MAIRDDDEGESGSDRGSILDAEDGEFRVQASPTCQLKHPHILHAQVMGSAVLRCLPDLPQSWSNVHALVTQLQGSRWLHNFSQC